MVQPACDVCGREMSRMDRQYVATVDLRPTIGADTTDEDPGDRDHLLEIHEMLESVEENEMPEDFQPQEYILCHECYCRIREEPFQREPVVQVGFSEN